MPELPEVETIRRHLAEVLPGRHFTALELRLPKLLRSGEPAELANLVGRPIERVERHAKQLLYHFAGAHSLLMHLKMTGQIVHEAPDGTRRCGGHPIPAFDVPLPHKSTHLIGDLDDGSRFYLTDVRQFGVLRVVDRAAVAALLDDEQYGPDALATELTPTLLAERLGRHARARLKPVLLDQTVLAGLGNIYVDEALFSARLHPLRQPNSLTAQELAALRDGIRDALDRGLRQGGFTIINGRAHQFEGYPQVHGRAGLDCPRCGGQIQKITVAARGTYLCPACQAMP